MTIRSYQEGDLTLMFRLFRDTVRQVNARDYSAEQVAAWAPDQLDQDSMARWHQRFARSITLLAFQEDRLVGYANVESDGHIDHFYVDAATQGMGVGRRLMEEIQRMSPVVELVAEVSITARPFFEKMGFVVEHERRPVVRGIEFLNFAMRRTGTSGSKPW